MRDRRVVDDEAVETHTEGPAWSPAQLVALVIGIFFIVLGAIALARTGFDTSNFTGVEATVLGLEHSTLLALVHIVFGLFMVGAGALPGADRVGMVMLGVIALAVGLVLIIESNAFGSGLGENHGWLYTITGGLSLLAAMVSPIFTRSDRRTVAR